MFTDTERANMKALAAEYAEANIIPERHSTMTEKERFRYEQERDEAFVRGADYYNY